MADSVIIVGSKRGPSHVEISELKQMAGRAGRKQGGKACLATIVVDSDDEIRVTEGMESDKTLEVLSAMGNNNRISFSLLSEVVSGNVRTVEDAENWMSRSLFFSQCGSPDMEKVLDHLVGTGTVKREDEVYLPTEMGVSCNIFYLWPEDMAAWVSNFDQLTELGEYGDISIAWAMASVPQMSFNGDVSDMWEQLDDLRSGCSNYFDFEKGSVVSGLVWWGALGGPPMGRLRFDVLAAKKDAARVLNAMAHFDRTTSRWGKSAWWEELIWRFRKGVSSDILSLSRIGGINKGQARFLKEKGVEDKADIVRLLDSFEDDIEGGFLDTLSKIREEGKNGKI